MVCSVHMGQQPSSGAQACLHVSNVNWPLRTSAPVLSDARFALAAPRCLRCQLNGHELPLHHSNNSMIVHFVADSLPSVCSYWRHGGE